jgi:DNA polymerase
MKTDIVLDFETVSACDLKEAGSARYAEDPTTAILCLCFEDKSTGTILPWRPDKPDNRETLRFLAADPEIIFVAHQAGFEKDIWRAIMVREFGFPDVPNERWHDTLAVCAQKGLPLDLETVVAELGIPGEKDMDGSKLVVSLSKINKKTGMRPEITPEIMDRVVAYCTNDVLIERELHTKIGWLQKSERPVWLLDQKINERGIMIDMDYVRACQKIVDEATVPLAEEFGDITGGLRFGQIAKIGDWLNSRDVFLPNLQKETLKIYLGGDIDDDEEDETFSGDDGDGGVAGRVPDDVRRALEIRQLIGSAAIKKLGRMATCVCDDGSARRTLQYHGAGPGRWAGRIFQPQNFPRPFLKDAAGDMIEQGPLVAAIMTGDWEYVQAMIGPPVHAVVHGLRHALVPRPGCTFVSGDYSQIEARIVLALAGQTDKVDLFVKLGSKIYGDMAQSIYGRPIDKKRDLAEYTIGKNTILGCGFQMGWKKFRARYCPDQNEAFAQRVIKTYREEWAPEVPKLWRALEEASLLTAWTKQPHEAYGVEYRIEGDWMTARLPSGRKLFYYRPTPCRKAMPWSTPEKPDIRDAWYYIARKGGVFKRVDMFGGIETENVVQALARDVLVEATFRLEANGFPIVLTVHDEDLGDVPNARVDERAFTEIMNDSSEWIRSLRIPIGVETWVGDRYRK